jgi:PST family polysaccharide transporter
MALARLLTPRQIGVFAMVAVVTRFLEVFREMGFGTVIVQRENIRDTEISGLFWLNAAVGVALASVVAICAPLIARFYDEPEVTAITLGVAVAFLLGSLSVQHQALLRRQMRFGVMNTVQLVATALGTACALLMAYWNWGTWSLVGKAVTNATLLTIGYFLATRWVPGKPMALAKLGSLVRFGRNVTGFNLVNFLSRNADNLIVGKIFGPQALGAYDRAYEVMNLCVRQVVGPASSVAVPALSRLAAEPDTYRSAYLRTLDKVLLVTTPLAALLLGAPDVVIFIALGDQWQDAIPLLTALGGLALVQPISGTTGWLFTTQDRTDEMFRWGLVSATISVGSFLLGATWGVAGVAWAYAASQLLRTPLVFWYLGRRGPVGQRALYGTLVIFLSAGLASAALVHVTAGALREMPIMATGGVCAIVSEVVVVLCLGLSGRGRRVLKDLPRVWQTLRGGER